MDYVSRACIRALPKVPAHLPRTSDLGIANATLFHLYVPWWLEYGRCSLRRIYAWHALKEEGKCTRMQEVGKGQRRVGAGV